MARKAKEAKKRPRKAAKGPASTPVVNQATASASYDDHKARVLALQRAKSRAHNDILPFPPISDADLILVERCRTDFGLFCHELFPRTFRLPFCADHHRSIAKIEESVIRGGLFAWAMTRGSGKTALAQASAIWASLYRWRPYVVIIGPDDGHANRMLRNVKTELRFNDRLAECFPLVCHPIRMLGGKAIRAESQHAGGEPTRITWTEGKQVLPTVAGSVASGAIFSVTGITGQIRGLSEVTGSGELIRPSFVIVDDFQTHESAMSESQCNTRESIILADVLELAGPGVEICGILPCTVIRQGDCADRLLNRTLHPEFRGERMKTLYALPKNIEWWNRYADVLRRSLEEHGNIEAATAMYRAEQAIADEGAVVAWAERFKPGEASALQSAMNVKILKPEVFAAEYQNEPLPRERSDIPELSPDQVAGKVNRIPRTVVPLTATTLTASFDVQAALLYWIVIAWESDFTGYVIDYGTWPDQGRSYYTLAEAQRTLATASPDAKGLEGQIYNGLEMLTKQILGAEWKLQNGTVARIERCLIDSGWGESTNVVFQFCRQSEYPTIVIPSKGFGVGAGARAIGERTFKPGERRGLEWYVPLPREARGIRQMNFDSNFWKSFVSTRLGVSTGSRGALSLFGDSPQTHRMFADHATAEFPDLETSERTGRSVVKWTKKPNRENHFLDCLVMATVGASMQGISLDGVHKSTRQTHRPRMTLGEMKAKAQGR